MKDRQYRNFIIFWFSQSVSQLGSSMTSFALIIWSYSRTGSAMSVSLMTFCTWLPYIAASIVAGPVIDRYHKKTIMLLADLLAALCSLTVAALAVSGNLAVWHIYRQWNHRLYERISVSGGDGGGGDAGSEGKVQPGQRLKFLYLLLTHCGDPGDGRVFILICRDKGCHCL